MTLVVVFIYCRMSAVAYLASYLSRAKFLSAALVASILQRFGNISSFLAWPNFFFFSCIICELI